MIWGSYDDMGGMGHIPASLPQLREKAQAVKKAEDVVKQARVIMGIWGSFLLEPLCWQEVGMGVDPSVRLLPPLGCLVDVTADCGWLYCATPMPLQNFNTGNIALRPRFSKLETSAKNDLRKAEKALQELQVNWLSPGCMFSIALN